MKDTDIYSLAIKVARLEFREHGLCYRCEVEDLAMELYAFYRVHILPNIDEFKSRADKAKMTLENYIVNAFTFETRCHIRRRELNITKRFKVESELLDGVFDANNYFEKLENAGMLHLWNDNEKIIDTKAKKPYTPNRPCSLNHSEEKMLPIEQREIWERLHDLLTDRDFNIILQIFQDEKTESEIAKQYGISQQAVHKVVSKLGKLSKSFKDYV